MSFCLDAFLKRNFSLELSKAASSLDPSSIQPDDEREWLLTNGLGSYASGSISGANTRRYHGLFVAALDPPTSRTLLFSRVDEYLDGENISTNLWTPDVVSPRGYEKINAFFNQPCPVWVLELADCYLVKMVFMLPLKQEAYLLYAIENKEGHESAEHLLDLHILANDRDYHGDTHGNGSWQFMHYADKNRLSIRATEDAHQWHLQHDGGLWNADSNWYDGYYFPRELERGLTDREDCFHPGFLRFKLAGGDSKLLVASLEPLEEVPETRKALGELLKHQDNLLKQAGNPDHPVLKQLVLASDAFLVRRDSSNSQSVIAGYHWFSDWGRDSMISLPGLTLATGRLDEARQVLQTYQSYLSQGMIPNNFPDAGNEPAYNTIDATFWWVWSLKKYLQASKDKDFIRQALPSLEAVLEAHVNGTRFNIKMDAKDGLLSGGSDGAQLTWMDAKVGEEIVTPRRGKPVEINALWYMFLKTLAEFTAELRAEKDAAAYFELAEKCKQGFSAAFWNSERNCLFDVINYDGSKDASVRPNQIFAISLSEDLLSHEQAVKVLQVVENELLTPFGLRSLSCKDPEYKGSYFTGKRSSNQWERDHRYHQGTVWPWLLGHWIDARLSVWGTNDENLALVKAQLALLLHHHLPFEAGLGFVSEIFDGDSPHKAQGCIAQAWSVAELLRAFYEHPELQGQAKVLSAAGV